MNPPPISPTRVSDLGAVKIIFACGKPRFGAAVGFKAKPTRDLSFGNLGPSANTGQLRLSSEMGAGCFTGRTVGSGLKVEMDSGGQDLFDAAAVEELNGGMIPEHLVVMVNGIVGR